MKIELSPFSYTRKEIQSIQVRAIRRRLRYLWLGVGLFAAAALAMRNVELGLGLLLGLLLTYPFVPMLTSVMTTGGKVARLISLERRVSVEDGTIHISVDGSASSSRLDHLSGAEEEPNHFLLSITRGTFVPIPKRAFQNETDVLAFRQALVDAELLKPR